MSKRLVIILCIIIAAAFCSTGCKKPKAAAFEVLDAASTGIRFANQLQPSPKLNLFTYMYYYNGAGVGAGDFNNDGRIDLFFAANQSANQLYLNQGGLQFKDVTAAAGIPADGAWSTGVSVVDINNDGLLDIYVCRVGNYKTLKGRNQLLVCKGISKDGVPSYQDEAAAYGIDFSGFSTQAAFFDFDLDGDLDLFLLNHAVNHDGNYAPRSNFAGTYDSLAGHRFYRNDQLVQGAQRSTRFTDITRQSGINSTQIGYGLGVVVNDFNTDGWPDLYIGNDFHENDYLYINQRNGRFEDESVARLMHTSQFSMGVDAADVTNDGLPEIISADMLPGDPDMLRRSLAEDDYVYFREKRKYGYHYQYARNNLQWNRGNGLFTEVGQYAGIYATDWSWAPLWLDFDNDGYKDLFVTNGIPKRMNDIDYVNFVTNETLQQKLRTNTLQQEDMKLVDQFPEIKLPNRFFRNKGQFVFDDWADSLSSHPPTFSNGAAYADLDNDGDLDLVVNNINDPALIYRNKLNDARKNTFAGVQLQGDSMNRQAIGARLLLFCGNELRSYEQQPVHGFLSSMQQPLHIGLVGSRIDSALLIWPDHSYQPVTLQPDTIIQLQYRRGLPLFDFGRILSRQSRPVSFTDISNAAGFSYVHQENSFNEFDREPLIPHMLSTEGPALAVADINHDGREDVFLGAAKGYPAAVLLQQPDGRFAARPQPALQQDSMWEHVHALWTDVNGDTHPDLLIASGGNEYYNGDEHLLPLLYVNDGTGMLSRKTDAFAQIDATQSVILTGDWNSDGKPDLFIGGRTIPWQYGAFPRSFLLQNDGTGRFTDVTEGYSKALLQPGMVTDAVQADINQDGMADLVLCYEWGGIDAFIKNGNRFDRQVVTATPGWWNQLLAFDADADGDVDLLSTNSGLNTKLQPTADEPIQMYYGDFDGNGRTEQVVTYFLQHKRIPFATKMDLEKQMPSLKKKYLYAADFATATLETLFGAAPLAAARQFQVETAAHTLWVNNKGRFEAKQLPWMTQVNYYRSAVVADMNNDQLPDLILGGNYYDNHVQLGRQDGDFGTVLLNKGGGDFEAIPATGDTRLEQVRHIQPILVAGKPAFVLARNNAAALLLQVNYQQSAGK